jgi:hypothetical protein
MKFYSLKNKGQVVPPGHCDNTPRVVENTELEPTAFKNIYYYGAKLQPQCHMAQ